MNPSSRPPSSGRLPPLTVSANHTTAPAPVAGGSGSFLDQLVRAQLINAHVAQEFQTQAAGMTTPEAVGNALVAAGHLTPYQLARIMAGKTYGLVMGNYRILDRLGSGSVGVVFRGEHILLRRLAAVKVLPVDDELPGSILERFYAEMRVLADLHHPHIVTAYDAGILPPPERGEPTLHYMVMELVPGGDLEQYVYDHGPLSLPLACEWIRQAASGLQEAHDNHLIHRDLKPSNLLRTGAKSAEGDSHPGSGTTVRGIDRVKITDFGLAREFCSTRTDPRMLLGSIEFMAPEQSIDPSAVGPPADIYGLGATMFWLLTGQTPYPMEQNIAAVLKMLQHDRPRRLKQFLPDVPDALDEFVDQMLQRDPARRPRLAVKVMDELAKFAASAESSWEVNLRPPTSADLLLPDPSTPMPGSSAALFPGRSVLVDGDDAIAKVLRPALEVTGITLDLVPTAAAAVDAIKSKPADVILIDSQTSGLDTLALCRQLRERPASPFLKIMVLAGKPVAGETARAIANGADDLLNRPLAAGDLAARVRLFTRVKDAQDRAEKLARSLMDSNKQLEDSLLSRSEDVQQAQDAMLFAMAKMAESRDGESSDHLKRLVQYTHVLAENVRGDSSWAGIIDRAFLDNLERCVPLHDIGKIGLPDTVLLKPGALDEAERALMKTHTIIGASMLDAIAREYGDSLEFLGMARGIVRSHHERYDGTGYPDGLAGEAIPAAARLVALADVYDALRRQRCHKPPLDHARSVEAITRQSQGQFDPAVLQAFMRTEREFARIFHLVKG